MCNAGVTVSLIYQLKKNLLIYNYIEGWDTKKNMSFWKLFDQLLVKDFKWKRKKRKTQLSESECANANQEWQENEINTKIWNKWIL